jgi:hypothetical protein
MAARNSSTLWPCRKVRSTVFISTNFFACDSNAANGFKACGIRVKIDTGLEGFERKNFKQRIQSAAAQNQN